MYIKLFIFSSVSVLMNVPNKIIKGTFRVKTIFYLLNISEVSIVSLILDTEN